MGVVQNSIDIQKIIEAGGDPTIAAKVQELEAEIGDENSGIIKDIDDLQEANALIMTSVSAIKLTADSAKAKADQAVLWSERDGYVGKNLLNNTASTITANGVTLTVNADKTVTITTAEGGATADTNINFTFNMPAGEYILSGCEGGSDATYNILVYNDNWTDVTHCYDGDTELVLTGNTTRRIMFLAKKDLELSDPVVLKPMIRLASVSDDTYESYLPKNDELLQTTTLKSVTAAAADFAAFKTAIAAL